MPVVSLPLPNTKLRVSAADDGAFASSSNSWGATFLLFEYAIEIGA